MFKSNSAVFSFSYRVLTLGALCLGGVAGVGGAAWAQTVPKEKVKAKAGAPEVGEAPIRLTPNPDNLALAPCPDPMPQRELNQYVISKRMPTGIALFNGNAELAERIRQSAEWSITGSAPPLRMVDEVVKTSGSVMTSSWIIGPTHNQAPPDIHLDGDSNIPAAGLWFDVFTNDAPSATSNEGWNFPSSNGEFGEKTLVHKVEGKNYDAKIALFYPSTGFQHPAGGPLGYTHAAFNGTRDESLLVPTPNYIYYYSQAWESPVKIEYWLSADANELENYIAYYVPGDDRVHLGPKTHGSHLTSLFVRDHSDTPLTFVGSEEVYGIDAFARIITHENEHKFLWETYNESIATAENDTVPDTIVDANGDEQANDPDADPDEDGVPSGVEIALGLDPLKKFSTELDRSLGGYGYADDQEVYVRLSETGVFGPREKDWADDGLNFGRRFNVANPTHGELSGCVRTRILDTNKNFLFWKEYNN